MRKNIKSNLTKSLSKRAAASLTRTFAMQSSPASARRGQSLRGSWAGQNPATSLQPDGECLGTCGWLTQALNHDSPSGELGSRWPGTSFPISAPQGTNPSEPFVQVCRMGLPEGPKRRHRYLAGHLQTGAGIQPASSGPDLPDRSALPCANLPQTHIILRTLGPKGRLYTRLMARSCSSTPSSAGATTPAPTLTIN